MCSPRSHDNLKLWLKAMLEWYPPLRGVTVAYNVVAETDFGRGVNGPLQLTGSSSSIQ